MVSIHLVERAALLDLPPAKKLVLMAFADAADRDTRVSAPGLVNVQRWASSSRSWVLAMTAELAEVGLLRKVRAGRRGKRAEYVVMPEGCCPEHGPVVTGIGSAGLDPVTVNGSSPPDPDPVDNAPSGSGGPDPTGGKGPVRVQKGSTSYRTPSPASLVQPPYPPTPAGAGGTTCARHGDEPRPGCRGCGTTVRQADARARAQAEADRLAAAAADNAARRQAQARASPPPAELLDRVRSDIAERRRAG